LVAEVDRSRQAASEQLAQLNELIVQSQQLEGGMGLRFLYDEERLIFAIGYQVAQRRLDNSFYDLLASEARLTSFLAIARGEVSVEHWWALSRPFGSAYGRLPLLSWSGTMFEYLMPLLFTQTHENSLLDRACHDAVHGQIAYAQQNSVPWGISESALSALDRHNAYQYRAFGVTSPRDYDTHFNDNAMRWRFHSGPRIRATEPLLHEHIPEQILPTTGEVHEERPLPRTISIEGSPVTQTPDIASARVHLLSNGT